MNIDGRPTPGRLSRCLTNVSVLTEAPQGGRGPCRVTVPSSQGAGAGPPPQASRGAAFGPRSAVSILTF